MFTRPARAQIPHSPAQQAQAERAPAATEELRAHIDPLRPELPHRRQCRHLALLHKPLPLCSLVLRRGARAALHCDRDSQARLRGCAREAHEAVAFVHSEDPLAARPEASELEGRAAARRRLVVERHDARAPHVDVAQAPAHLQALRRAFSTQRISRAWKMPVT